MGLGNGNYQSGNQGSSYDFERKFLMALQAIIDALETP